MQEECLPIDEDGSLESQVCGFSSVEGPCADDVVVTLQPFFFLFLGTLTFSAYWALVELLTDQHEPSPCIACEQG